MNHFKKTAMAIAVSHIAALTAGAALAQSTGSSTEGTANANASVVVVSGQRAALQSAQKIKQDADEVVDSINAEDIGKLPDRSVTEVLQRVVGVTIDRSMAGDPQHYAVEGSGVAIRGLNYVRSELNGRDSFSANGARSLSFEDVPPELMAGVDVYKNPSAEQIEGAISGLVNLRTAMPFDFKGFKGSVSGQMSYSTLREGKPTPSTSLLLSDRWKTRFGEFGLLVDFARSQSDTRTDNFQIEPYYPRDNLVPGRTVWVPTGVTWRTMEFERERKGQYAAAQWRPNRDLSTSLTYFKSSYENSWSEQAMLMKHTTPYAIQVANGVYDANGALLSGTLSDPEHGGINLNPDRRVSSRNSSTTDIAWNVQWRVNQDWTIRNDVQRIRAKTGSLDSDVATGMLLQKQGIDLTTKLPTLHFDDADRAAIANPNNYYWAYTMEHLDRSTASNNVWKTDVQYNFDHAILRDVRFGVRFTDRKSLTQNSNPSYNWQAITQPYMLGWNIPTLAYLGDPRFNNEVRVHPFNNFFNGDASVPAAVFPSDSLARGYPDSYATLHSYHTILCEQQAATQGWGTCDPWKRATFGTDPAEINDVAEKTKAFYTQLRFGFDDLKYPVDGNIGVRYVKTDMRAAGYTVFTPNVVAIPPGAAVTGVPVPDIKAFSRQADFEHAYSNVLPSLNLRLKGTGGWQFRLALAKAMSRPDFGRLQAYNRLSQQVNSSVNPATGAVNIDSVSLTGEASGNPMLKPTMSTQLDVTAEWYFAPGGSFTVALFNKRLKDIVVDQMVNVELPDTAGAMHRFATTSPVNGAKGHARGFELAYQQYYDNVPNWLKGIGVQASFTFVDSARDLYNPVYSEYCSGSADGAANLNLNINGCDTDGRVFGNLPLQGLSRQSANLSLMYDRGPVSARVAYNWRSRSLQSVNAWGARGTDGKDTNPASPTYGAENLAWGLPLWAEAYGQIDASIFYKLTEKLSIGLEAQNLTDVKFRQTMDQHIGNMNHTWFKTGPRYTAQLRYDF
ncbi:TonB-dependent receptor [Pseudoduganella lutea]|uniref:TonB-dependent receptor n=1 Tax=Pseudoduganella lutea TaxID=321985 RepID=A0A4P6L1H0_9BURK|nr:TonB-dependent receptor [Pseudoduganella lutea]QBE65376.1 TonB-dependent receptor [Pseudoduganella lutea]